ncbi:MAG: hypothetical protein E7257_06730 [Lachnospiraceae bacterium]|nr:hypothetical protein [Lachnospiraceae bacterium]
MELKKDTTENVKFAYENEGMPNPNDTLFGNPGAGLGGDNNLNNTYISDEPTFVKKSEKPKWMLGAVIIVAIAAIAIIGVFAVKMLGGSKVDGAYVLAKAETGGMEYTVEELESTSGMSFYMRLEIDGKEGYLVMSFAGMVEDGSVTIDVDGSDIHVSRDGTELLFKYDKKTDTVSYEKDGTKLIFERIQ